MVQRNMDAFGPEEMATPEVKLVQNTGGDEAKASGAMPGDLYISLTGEVIQGETGLDFVIADIIKTRTYWGRDEIGIEPPACASVNDRSGFSIFGNKCSECDKRVDMPGMLDKAERREKCLPAFNILGIRANESRMPVLVRASGISVKHARQMITALKINKEVAGAYEKVLVHLASVKEKTASGEAYAFTFKLAGLLKTEQSKIFLAETERLLGVATMLPEGYENTPKIAAPEPAAAAVVKTEEAPQEIPLKKEKKTVKAEPKPEPKPEPKTALPEVDLNF